MNRPFQNPADSEIAELLRNTKRIAVVGMSSKPERPSHAVAQYLIQHGYEVIPVNPTEAIVLGQTSYASIKEVPGKIDVVDVFRRSDQTDPVIEEAMSVGAKAIWLQLEVINESGCLRAQQAGLTAVQNRCIKIEHSRLL